MSVIIRVTKKTILSIAICLFLLSNFVSSSQAIGEIEYSLQIKVTTSCPIPYQSVSPISVDVELTNLGNETFNGTLTIKGRTKDSTYTSREYPISNLTKDVVLAYMYRVSTDYAGRYWFTIEIEEEHLSRIILFQDSRTIDEGNRVKTTSSIFIRSFSEFIAIVGIVVGAIVSIGVAIYLKKRD